MEPSEIRWLFTPEQIAARVRELGASISADYAGKELVIVCVLKGSFVFAADLIRAIELPLGIDFLGLQSYGDGVESSGVVRITLDLARPIADCDVLIVEDIVDTGLTLSYLIEQLKARGPRSLKVCSLLNKPARLIRAVPIDYLGFTIEDVFVVGYGLDHAQQHRNLSGIAVIDDGTRG